MSTVEKAYGGTVHRYPSGDLAGPGQHVAPQCDPGARHDRYVVANSFPYGRLCPDCFPKGR